MAQLFRLSVLFFAMGLLINPHSALAFQDEPLAVSIENRCHAPADLQENCCTSNGAHHRDNCKTTCGVMACFSSTGFFLIPAAIGLENNAPFASVNASKFGFVQGFHSSIFLSIWQPPKIA